MPVYYTLPQIYAIAYGCFQGIRTTNLINNTALNGSGTFVKRNQRFPPPEGVGKTPLATMFDANDDQSGYVGYPSLAGGASYTGFIDYAEIVPSSFDEFTLVSGATGGDSRRDMITGCNHDRLVGVTPTSLNSHIKCTHYALHLTGLGLLKKIKK